MALNLLNETMCWWEQPRSAVIRDVMYLDGGYLAFLPGTHPSLPDLAPRRFLYYIDFSQQFNTSQNSSDIIHTTPKPNGSVAVNYYDGTMFANDNEFYLYGGLLRNTDSQAVPEANEILGYERFQYGPYRSYWAPGWNTENLPSGLTRYIYGGAGANIPSENLGFYFSGLRGVNWGDIRDDSDAYKGNVSANTLISVDLSVMRGEKWRNKTLPWNIVGRAGAELAWIPVSTQGVLLVIGGVINPEYGNFLNETQKLQSQTISPMFTKEIPVYDIAGQKWYIQNTTGEAPGAITQFCSVVASASDRSSHSVYVYGGYSGIDITETYVDDVYILSVPSFVWIKVYTGTAQHGRIRHKCSKPYPDQMFVVGGVKSADPTDCLDGGMIQIFNLNNLTWQKNYDPHVWSEYKVPPAIFASIGGNADGGATRSPDVWGDSDLSTLFGNKYSKTITNYYPYSKIPVSGFPQTHSGVPPWIPAVLGTVFGLLAIALLVICGFLYHRRWPLPLFWAPRGRASRKVTSVPGLYELPGLVAAIELPTNSPDSARPTPSKDTSSRPRSESPTLAPLDRARNCHTVRHEEMLYVVEFGTEISGI